MPSNSNDCHRQYEATEEALGKAGPFIPAYSGMQQRALKLPWWVPLRGKISNNCRWGTFTQGWNVQSLKEGDTQFGCDSRRVVPGRGYYSCFVTTVHWLCWHKVDTTKACLNFSVASSMLLGAVNKSSVLITAATILLFKCWKIKVSSSGCFKSKHGRDTSTFHLFCFLEVKSLLFVRNVTHTAHFHIDLTKESRNFSSPCPEIKQDWHKNKKSLITPGRF